MIPGLEAIPTQVTISGGTAGALVAAQVAQLGFEARLLSKTTRLETVLAERADDDD